MKCDQCQNEASVFLTEFNSGEIRKVNLCEECARERSVVDEATGLELTDLLWGLDSTQKVSLENEGAEQELLCPVCGFSDADFDKSERLGCPDCYEVFAERLSGMWKNFQKSEVHVGKRMEMREGLAPFPTGLDAPTETVPPAKVGAAAESAPAAEPKEAQPNQGRQGMDGHEQERAIARKISELQAQMQEALREEAYEHAATLRDAIRTLEKDLVEVADAPAEVK